MITTLFFCFVVASSPLKANAHEKEHEHPFHNALRILNFDEARRLLNERGSVVLNELDRFGMLPLHIAASLGSEDALEFLLNAGVDAAYRPQQGYSEQLRGRSPLHLAVASGNTLLVELLIEEGADLFAQDINGSSPLHLAIQYGRLGVTINLLETMGQRAQVRDKNGTTPLHLAARHGRNEIIHRLLLLDKEANKKEGQLKIMATRLQKLLGREANLTSDKNLEQRVLRWGKIWRKVLTNTQNNFGLTPLHYASSGGHAESVEILLEHGAKINQINNQNLTPLYMASRRGHERVVEILTSRSDADIERGDLQVRSPLWVAVANGHLQIFDRLLKKGADPNAKDKNNMSPLHIATKHGNAEVVKALLRAIKISNINERDNIGNTPLLYATLEGKKEIVEILIQKGADTSMRNHQDQTPIDIAQQLGYADILLILR